MVKGELLAHARQCDLATEAARKEARDARLRVRADAKGVGHPVERVQVVVTRLVPATHAVPRTPSRLSRAAVGEEYREPTHEERAARQRERQELRERQEQLEAQLAFLEKKTLLKCV